MKTRSSEAHQLENEYIARIKAVLAGQDPEEIAAIVQSVREHIEMAAGDVAEAEVSLPQMRDILERLGPAEAYLMEDGARRSEAAPLEVSTRVAGGADRPLEFGSCFSEAVDFFAKNFVPLLLASVLTYLLSLLTCLIVSGVMHAGALLMVLHAMRREDQKVRVGEVFSGFQRFWLVLFLTLFQTVILVPALLLLIIPGVLLMAVWMYTELLVLDRRMGWDALGASWRMATHRSFSVQFLLMLACTGILLGSGFVPYVGVVLEMVVTPIFWTVTVVAYQRQLKSIGTPERLGMTGVPAVM